jgi:signal transduction histidine kinase
MSFEAAVFEKNIVFLQEIAEGITILTNKDLFEKLIFNLTENACKYTPEGGKILVKLVKNKKGIVYSIRNTGKGIPAENMKHIFERFYRLDNARSQSGSNSFGLGLAIAKSISDKLEATLTVDSVEMEYTEFSVYFKG